MIERLRPLVAWGQRVSLDYQRTRASLAAGGLAYFVALSIAPAALAFGTVAGLVLDPQDVRETLQALVARVPGGIQGADAAIDTLVNVISGASSSAFTIATIISVLIAIYASSKVVFGLRMAMDTTFGLVEPRSGLIERAIAAVITLIGLVIGVALIVLLTLLPRILQWLNVDTSLLSTGSWVTDWLLVIVLVYLAVKFTLSHAPHNGPTIPWLSPGVLLGAGGIIAATIGVGIYARYSTSLGAAVLVFGTAVVILLWLYLCFVALLWGAIVEADRQRQWAGPSTTV